MKTKEIEIYDIIKTQKGYEAEYSTDTASCTLEIDIDTLITYIMDNELNVVEFINYAKFSMDCDGLDQTSTDPYEYLEENYFEVVYQYLNDLHKC